MLALSALSACTRLVMLTVAYVLKYTEHGNFLHVSQVIESYLLDKYKGIGPDLLPPTPELRAKAALAARIVDLYICSVQGCMYKQMDSAEKRAQELQSIAKQLDILEEVIVGPFVAGRYSVPGDIINVITYLICQARKGHVTRRGH
jgi:hypothetical protein